MRTQKQKKYIDTMETSLFTFNELFHALPVPSFYQKKGESYRVNKNFTHAFGNSSTDVLEKIKTLPKNGEQTLELTFDNNIKKNVTIHTSAILNRDKDIIGLAGVLFDISGMQKSKELLLTQKQRLELALDNSQEGIWDWDIDRDVFFYSPKWKSIMGYAPNESPHVLSSWLNLVHTKDMAMVNEKIKKHLDGESEFFFVEHRIRNSNPIQWVRVQGKGIVGKNNLFQRMIGTIQDISLQKREEEAQKQYQELFTSFVAHLPVIAFIKNMEGKYLYMNNAYQKYIGFQTWKDKSADTLFSSTTADTINTTDRLALYERIIKHNVILPTEEGAEQEFTVYKFPIENDDGEKLLCGFGIKH